ncbi:MAG: glutamate-1-semialdehyde 2,1-aminomutase [Chitinophagales bacterium]|nr:MAG: glutamate-1-semialdehyde 2,1-aminomutase [Chitinophagales bacterium]
MKTQRSEELFAKACRLLPGGVNSPVRSFKAVGGHPLFIRSAQGAILQDEDGNTYIDYVGSWGPMILGHAHPAVTAALQEAVVQSVSFGAPVEAEMRLAEVITRMVPGMGKIRMVNSGTEACMSAVRLARAFTRKSKILKFEGCYHGHADAFLVKAGSGMSTLGIPNAAGVPPAAVQDTIIVPFNNLKAVERAVDAYKNEIAAIITEPVAGNMGCIAPAEHFLAGLRHLCDEAGALLIFDEVMTGFRLAPGGAAERFGIQPDLFTFGKIIGGGLPVGAYGGRAEIMDLVAPVGPVYQAGTLSGNPLAMTAGFVTLQVIRQTPGFYEKLEEQSHYLESGLREALGALSVPFQINRVGSMLSVHFTEKPVMDFASAREGDNVFFRKFFHHMLQAGIYLPPSPYEAWFVSALHEREHLDRTIAAAASFRL